MKSIRFWFWQFIFAGVHRKQDGWMDGFHTLLYTLSFGGIPKAVSYFYEVASGLLLNLTH